MLFQRAEWERAVGFHGHGCPGLAIGFRATSAAREKLGISFCADEEVVCVTENDACGVDAVQILTGCSLGKGNLVYRGTGKMAFSSFCRSNGGSLRMICRPLDAQLTREQKQQQLLDAPIDDVFTFMKPAFVLPERARCSRRWPATPAASTRPSP